MITSDPGQQHSNPSSGPLQGIPALETDVHEVTLPEQRTRTVTIESENGKTEEQKEDASIPFSAALTVYQDSPQKLLRDIGLDHSPNSDVSIELSEKEGVLHGTISSTYTDYETRYKTVRYNERWDPPGTQHYPYGPKSTVGEWSYDEKQEPYKARVQKRERTSGAIEEEAFHALYTGVYNAAQEGSSEAATLLSFLEDHYPDECQSSRESIRETIADVLAAARAEEDSLAKQLAQLTVPPRDLNT
jgi:hypothetical protein